MMRADMKNIQSEKFDPEWSRAVQTFKNGDFAGALYLFKKLEKAGSLDAIAEIGNIYELGGGGVEQDFLEAKKWHTKALNYANDPMACLALGRLYYFGNGVEQNYEKSFSYFNRLKEQNMPGALYALGRMYEKGEGTNQDLDVAQQYYEKAIQLGHAVAQRDIGLVHIKKGSILLGIIKWCIGSINIFKIAYRDPEDKRLFIA